MTLAHDKAGPCPCHGYPAFDCPGRLTRTTPTTHAMHAQDAKNATLDGFRHDYGQYCDCTQCVPLELPAGADDWLCECGNRPDTGGFHFCNAVGQEVEPTAELWPEPLYICGGCKAIYKAV